MKKSFWLKLLVFALAVSMVLSFAACDRGQGDETTVKTEKESTETNTNQTTEPKTPDTTEPKTPDTTEPKTPDTTEPTTPDTTEPTTPDTTEPTTPDTTEPTTPDTTEPTTPDTTEPTTPDTTEPTTPDTTEPTTPDTTEPTTPDTTEPTTPDTTEPTTPEVDPDNCEHEYEWKYNTRRHWKECSKCENVIESGDHSIGDDYVADGTDHWQECTICCGVVNKSEHVGSYVSVDDETHKQVCMYCKNDYGVTEHSYNMISKVGEEHKCVCGNTIECPAVNAECEYNDEGHWYTEECELCQISTQLKGHVAHRFVDGESGKNVLECAVCDLHKECDGDHFESSAEGHKIGEDCIICNITAEADIVPHDWKDPVDRSRECKVCGYVEVCTANHYASDETGHRIKENCDICQVTEQTDMSDHDEGYTIVKNTVGENVVYDYICATCGYSYYTKTISKEVNYFSAPGQVVGGHATTVGDLVIDEDGAYVHITAGGSANFKLHNGVVEYDRNGKPVTSMNNRTDTIVGGPGKYVVIKIRLGGLSLGELKIGLYDGNEELPIHPVTNAPDTDRLYDSNTRTITEDMIIDTDEDGVSDGWLIYVVDLSSLLQKYYDITDTETDKISAGLKIRNGGTGTIDLAYFAIVDDWDEAVSVIGTADADATVEFTPNWKDATKDVTFKGNGDCVDHVMGYREVEGSRESYDACDDKLCYKYQVEPYCTACGESLGSPESHDVEHSFVTNEQKTYVGSIDKCYTSTIAISCENCSWADGDSSESGHKLGLPTVEGNVYTYVCTDAGCINNTYTKTIPEGVNFFSAPGQIVNNWATGSQYSAGGLCQGQGATPNPNHTSDKQTLTDLSVTAADGVYTRVHLYQGASFYLTNGTADAGSHAESAVIDTLNGGPGSYVVVRMRTNSSWLKISIVTDTGKTYAAERTNPSGEFTTYVVDISNYKDANAQSVRVMFYMNTGATPAGSYIDVAYLAIVDGLDDVAAVVGDADAQVTFVTNWADAASDLKRTASNGCIDHITHIVNDDIVAGDGTNPDVCYTCNQYERCMYCDEVNNLVAENVEVGHDKSFVYGDNNYDHSEGMDVCYIQTTTVSCSECDWEDLTVTKTTHKLTGPTTAVVGEDTVHTYSCTDANCDKTWTNTVAAGVNYYSAPGYVVSQHHATYKVMNEGDMAFTRLTLDASASFKLHTGVDGTKKMSDPVDAISGGSGQYIVMKIRLGGMSIGELKIGLYDGSKEIPLYPGQSFLDTDKLFDSYVRKVTEGMIIDSDADGVSDGWLTYVVDISGIGSEWYTANNPETQTISAGLKIQNGGTGYIDVAYFAIVDDWTEVAVVVGNEAENITFAPEWKDATQDKTRKANGTCVEHTVAVREEDIVMGDGTNADVCYTYTEVQYCSACGQMEEIRTEGKTKGHNKSTEYGDITYDHSEGLDVCGVQTTTVSCSECDWEDVTVTKTTHKLTGPTTAAVGEDTVHTYSCTAGCNKTWTNTVAAGVNYYSAPGMIANSYNTNISSVYNYGDFAYTRIKFGASGQARFHNEAGKNTAVKSLDDTIVGGPGQYVVMKIRVGNTTMSSIGLALWDGNKALSTAHPYSESNPNVDAIFGATGNSRAISQDMVNAGWVIYVIDISSLNQTWYDVTDAETNLISAGIKAMATGAQTDTSWIDIAYFAIVDDWTEISAVVGSDTTEVEFVPQWNDASKDATRKTDGTCIDHVLYTDITGVVAVEGVNADVCCTSTDTVKCKYCDYSETPKTATTAHKLGAAVVSTNGAGDTVYTYTCTVDGCGDSFTVVDPTGTNYFSAPGQQINIWASSNAPTQGNTSGSKGFGQVTLNNIIVDGTDGVYNRIYTNAGSQFYFSNGTATRTDGNKGVADVLNGGTGRYMVLKARMHENTYLQVQFTTNVNKNYWPARDIPEADMDDFIVYVIDMGYVLASEAEIAYVGFAGRAGTSMPAGAYVDIAYFALASDWETVEKIVGEGEKVVYSTDFANPDKDENRYSDGSCIDSHSCTLTTTAQGTTNTYTYSCSFCDYEQVRTVSIDADNINYYIAPNNNFGYSVWNAGVPSGRDKVIGNVNYDSEENIVYTEVGFWQGGAFELTNGTSTPVVDMNDASDTICGLGRYAVVKLRLGEGMNDGLAFGVWDGMTGTTVGSDSLCKLRADIETGEWIVYVIDLTHFSDSYTVGGESDKVTFAFKNGWTAGDNSHESQLDFAYFAVCDNWSEVKTVVGDEDVVLTNWTNSAVDVGYTSAEVDALVADEQAQ